MQTTFSVVNGKNLHKTVIEDKKVYMIRKYNCSTVATETLVNGLYML